MADTRKIAHGSPFATPEQRSKRLQGFLGGFYEGITELPLMAAEMLAPGSGYTPGELRSSPKDRLRAEQFEIQEFMQQMEQNPEFSRGAELGYGASMVFDPVIDLGIAAAPVTYKGLRGLARLLESGELGSEIAGAGRRLAASEVGSISGGPPKKPSVGEAVSEFEDLGKRLDAMRNKMNVLDEDEREDAVNIIDKIEYPKYGGFNPIHPVEDKEKVLKLVEDAIRGDEIPPYVIEGSEYGGSMLTGTHRAAANQVLEELGREERIPYVFFDEIEASDELVNAVSESDFERINELLD